MLLCVISEVICSSLHPFSSGLNTLYQGEAELSKLLKLVLTEGEHTRLNTTDTSTVLWRLYLIWHVCV